MRYGPIRRSPFATFAAVTVGVVTLVALSWRSTSARITALEERLQGLTVTVDQRLPTGGWRDEIERVAKRLEARVDERIRSEQRHLTAGLDARQKALATSHAPTSALEGDPIRAEAVAPASAELAAAGRLAGSTTDSADGLGLEEEEAFEETYQSMILSLGLAGERQAEVEAGLKEVLASLWPEYVARSKSANPDPGDLRQRYCAGVELVLSPEEAARLACGEDEVVSLAQPPEEGTWNTSVPTAEQ